MAQHDLAATGQLGRDGPRQTTESLLSSPEFRRYWAPRVASALLLLFGGVFAYCLPAIWLADGSGVSLDSVGSELALAGSGWVLTLGWFAVIVGVICSLAFPPEERFVEAIGVTASALAAMVVPYYVSTHLAKADENASRLGEGLIFAWVCFGLAAVLPWFGLFVLDRSKPVLGRDWSKWLFVLPAIVWVFLLTIFPLVYAFTTSRYNFRNGKISRFVGWDNYRELFDTSNFGQAVLGTILVAAIATAALLVLGAAWTFLNERSLDLSSLVPYFRFAPVIAIPAAIVYLSGRVLADPLDVQLQITFIFVAGATAAEMVLGFLIALLMNRELKGRGTLRAIMTLPIFGTPIALGYMARGIFYEQGGPLNAGLESLGINGPPWLSDPQWAKVATMLVDIWQWTPFVFIIALAGLQSLPQDILEASEVDGATTWHNLRYITLPMMAPILWLIFLLRAIDAFKVFDIPQGLTLGGPGRSTEYYSLFTYRTARKFFNYGDAAAQAFLLLVVVMILVSLLWGRIRHIYEDEGVRA